MRIEIGVIYRAIYIYLHLPVNAELFYICIINATSANVILRRHSAKIDKNEWGVFVIPVQFADKRRFHISTTRVLYAVSVKSYIVVRYMKISNNLIPVKWPSINCGC